MNTTYLVAFVLAAVPYAFYLVGMVFMGFSAQRATAPNRDRRVVIWLATFSVLAFALALWQQTRLSRLFGNWPANLDIESKTVLGVDIPLALGSGIFDLVGTVFWLLIQLTLIGMVVIVLFRPLPDKPLPKRVLRVVLVVITGLFALTGWPELVTALEQWQELF